MAKYINGQWILDKDIRDCYFKIGDIVHIFGQDLKITDIKVCSSYSGEVGSLKHYDKILNDEDFNFLHYHIIFDKWYRHNDRLFLSDERVRNWLDGTNKNYEPYGDYVDFYNENPPPPIEESNEEVYVFDEDWDYKKETDEVVHYPLYIKRPSKININREDFHNLSYYGIGTFMISYPIFFEECKGGIIVYANDEKSFRYFNLPRFDNLIKKYYPSIELYYMKIPREHKLYGIIHKYLQNYIIY